MFDRYVLVAAATAGLDSLDLVDHLGARGDFAEYAVTPALRTGRRMVEDAGRYRRV